MGIDSFKTDDSEETEDEQQEDIEETTSDEDVGGLDSFKSDSSVEDEEEERAPWIEDIGPQKWRSMSVEERVEFVRENYKEDYYPNFKLDDRWEFNEVIEIDCVCGNSFTFMSKGVCMECGREYKQAERTVVKISEPKEQQNNE